MRNQVPYNYEEPNDPLMRNQVPIIHQVYMYPKTTNNKNGSFLFFKDKNKRIFKSKKQSLFNRNFLRI